ncbi:hypothetical protein PY092_17610 [Muricauda sp. 334s03]|uniref:DUF4890 domain-containing protein n=1 Tax=Flagellimonas yonaguniensis TaxID=3031325 RepID=A0ABT5Y3N4_9FLAO|nr:hypothetical protein [[Muricauda] yonaguniensis]MDF0717985.1 hypothetical protein [[Muricauda] yonaguniensis]
MKRIAVVLVMLISIGMTAQRQDDQRMRKGPKMDMTAEEMATLQTKRMTLALDLTEAQQDKVYDIQLENAKFRKEKWDEIKALKDSGEWKKPTSEERYEMENARLDRQIAMQEKMRNVLDENQYETWKKFSYRKKMHGKKKMQERGRRG